MVEEPAGNMKRENKIRKEIFKLVKKLYKSGSGNKEFVPGRTAINYAGRIYDWRELNSLVDASLNFWLTEGRYT
jgi:CDP-6-deoxy-D-xylo-4-hexulose-3-dehydrase